jgi:hypothetical protein
MNSMRTRWARCVARIGIRTTYTILIEKPEAKRLAYLRDPNIHWRIILKEILTKQGLWL